MKPGHHTDLPRLAEPALAAATCVAGGAATVAWTVQRFPIDFPPWVCFLGRSSTRTALHQLPRPTAAVGDCRIMRGAPEEDIPPVTGVDQLLAGWVRRRASS